MIYQPLVVALAFARGAEFARLCGLAVLGLGVAIGAAILIGARL